MLITVSYDEKFAKAQGGGSGNSSAVFWNNQPIPTL